MLEGVHSWLLRVKTLTSTHELMDLRLESTIPVVTYIPRKDLASGMLDPVKHQSTRRDYTSVHHGEGFKF